MMKKLVICLLVAMLLLCAGITSVCADDAQITIPLCIHRFKTDGDAEPPEFLINRAIELANQIWNDSKIQFQIRSVDENGINGDVNITIEEEYFSKNKNCSCLDVWFVSGSLPYDASGRATEPATRARKGVLLASVDPRVIAHEFGHCLNLSHDSRATNLMNPESGGTDLDANQIRKARNSPLARGLAYCPNRTNLRINNESSCYPVESEIYFTADVLNQVDVPISGIEVDLEVINGPDTSAQLTEVTDQYGQAEFSFTGTTTGTDVFIASFTGDCGEVVYSDPVYVPWCMGYPEFPSLLVPIGIVGIVITIALVTGRRKRG